MMYLRVFLLIIVKWLVKSPHLNLLISVAFWRTLGNSLVMPSGLENSSNSQQLENSMRQNMNAFFGEF